MSTTTVSTTSTTTASTATSGLSDIEWIVIVVVLVIVLIVLVIAIAKCLEIGKSSKPKSLLQDYNAQSLRSETVRSTTTRSVASTKAKSTNMKKLPLNAEITRFSAGRVSRSAEYGVVIKDIKKTVQGDEPANRMSPPPSYHEHTDTLNTYKENTLSSPPNANLIVNQQYASHGTAPPNSKAVFVAPDELYSSPYSHAIPRSSAQPQTVVQPNQVMVDMRYPILTQPTVLLQQQ